jgi:hypothetical protein
MLAAPLTVAAGKLNAAESSDAVTRAAPTAVTAAIENEPVCAPTFTVELALVPSFMARTWYVLVLLFTCELLPT